MSTTPQHGHAQNAHTEQDRQFDRVLLFLRFSVIAALVLVLGRVAQLQIAPSPALASHIQPRSTTKSLDATRGDLLDRRGRVLATTRIMQRVIIDPVMIEPKLDQAVVGLAELLDMNPGELGTRIIGSVIENSRRSVVIAEHDARVESGQAPAVDEDGNPVSLPKLSRYLPVGGLLDSQAAEAIKSWIKEQKIKGVYLEDQPVRESSADELVGSIVGKLGFKDEQAVERSGIIGAEHLFNDSLNGTDGKLTYVRDAWGGPLWVQRGAWTDDERGQDIRLSIDLEIQRIVLEELRAGAEFADSAGARAVVINPHTGEVLAMADVMRDLTDIVEFPWYDPDSDVPAETLPDRRDQPRYRILEADEHRGSDEARTRNRCVRDLYEPGSTFKPFVWSLAKTRGVLPDDEIIQIENNRYNPYSRRIIEDVTPMTELSWDDVLEYSSNIGMTLASERLDEMDLRNTITALGFGKTTGLRIMGEQAGLVTSEKNWSHWTQTSVSMGYEVGVTPMQMVRAFSVFARNGDMAGTLPQLRLTASGLDSRTGLTKEEIMVERVFDIQTAQRVRGPMTLVAQNMDDKDRRFNQAPAPTYSMFGKSGTAKITCNPPKGLRRPNNAKGFFEKQYNTSFIVAAPAQNPEIVVLVVMDDPGPEHVKNLSYYGSRVAGPVVRKIVERVLPYLGVMPDLPVDDLTEDNTVATN
ncbi:MAG: peptidoglycan D,D-transpeptidase FtsI family protein [Phycisphaerales bacterium]